MHIAQFANVQFNLQRYEIILKYNICFLRLDHPERIKMLNNHKNANFLQQKCKKSVFIYMKFEPEKILSACQRNESDAQKCLYEHFAPSLMGICMRYMSTKEEAEDIFQEGFIKIFESINQLQSADMLWPWMSRIMVNQSIDYLREKSRLQFVDIENVSDTYITGNSAFDTDNYQLNRVLAVLQKLPDINRLVFNMREIEGIDFETIAQELNITEPYARCIISRTRKILREKLSKS